MRELQLGVAQPLLELDAGRLNEPEPCLGLDTRAPFGLESLGPHRVGLTCQVHLPAAR